MSNYYHDRNKRVLLVKGNIEKLLKGTTTNRLDAPMNAIINLFGKIEVAFAQKVEKEQAYIVLEQQYVGRLQQLLEKYLRLTKATINETPLRVYHVIGEEIKKDLLCIPQRIGYLLLAEHPPVLEQMGEETYTALRVESNIAVQGIDFDQELILNTVWKDLACLTKGCYLGQEVVARVVNLGKPPKKMIRVLMKEKKRGIVIDGKEIAVTSVCYSVRYQSWIGFCLVKNEDRLKDLTGC